MRSSNLRPFFVALLLSLPFWLGVNALSANVESAYLERALAANEAPVSALQERLRERVPFPNSAAPSIEARAAYSVLVKQGSPSAVLFSQHGEKPVPIASLAKLMTAYAVARTYEEQETVTVSEAAVAEPEDFGELKAGERLSVQELLHPLLMESSNDAAAALAEHVGRELFVARMQQEARVLGLEDTVFTNPTGLDPSNGEEGNRASARDLSVLLSALEREHPDVFAILGKKQYDVTSADGSFHHAARTTNMLLWTQDLPVPVLAGKTGETPNAKGALLLATGTPAGEGYLVHVVLGAEDRFGEIRKLVDWTVQGHTWKLPL